MEISQKRLDKLMGDVLGQQIPMKCRLVYGDFDGLLDSKKVAKLPEQYHGKISPMDIPYIEKDIQDFDSKQFTLECIRLAEPSKDGKFTKYSFCDLKEYPNNSILEYQYMVDRISISSSSNGYYLTFTPHNSIVNSGKKGDRWLRQYNISAITDFLKEF